MDLKEQVYSVLVVSASEKFNQSLAGLLPQSRFSPVRTVSGVGAARRELLERPYDLVLINTPLPDQSGVRLAIDLCGDSGTGVLLFVKSEHYAEVADRVEDYGVLTLQKPTSSGLVSQSLHLLCGTRERLRRMEQKTASIAEKMEEIRLVNRAKWLLISELKMTESDAHRYIEKQAMDRCVTRRAVAESILKTYQ